MKAHIKCSYLRFGTLVRILYQEMNMSNKDDGLSQLVQDVIDGKAEKKELCNKITKRYTL